MRLLTSLICQNNNLTLNSDKSQVQGQQLERLLLNKFLEMSPQGVKKIFAYLLDMAYQKVDGHLRVLQSDSKVDLIPRLTNLEILKLPFSLLKQVPAE